MTYFLIHDELEHVLESLEPDVCLHALATTAYSALGHASAKRCLDGAAPAWLLRKRLPNWTVEMVDRAAKALVSVGLWEAREDGYGFVDWDVHQYTKSQETARKAKQNERQRRRRALVGGLINIAENENVTRDVTRESRAPSPSPSPSPLPSPKENSEQEEERERQTAPAEPAPSVPKKAREPKKRDADKELFRKVVAEVGTTFNLLSLSVPKKWEAQALAKAREFAAIEALPLADAVRQIAKEGVQRQLDAGKAPEWGPVNWQPAKALRSVKKGIAPCAPRSAFRDMDPNEFCDALGW